MGSQDQGHHLTNTIAEHHRHYLGDQRRGVFRGEIARDAPRPPPSGGLLKRLGLRLGDLIERRHPPDGLVAFGELLHLFLSWLPSPADMGKVRLHLAQAPRRPVGHEQHPDHPLAPWAWTQSTRRATRSGGVAGRMPWPRLKMWPTSIRPSPTIVEAFANRSSSWPRSSVGSRFPWRVEVLSKIPFPWERETRQ